MNQNQNQRYECYKAFTGYEVRMDFTGYECLLALPGASTPQNLASGMSVLKGVFSSSGATGV